MATLRCSIGTGKRTPVRSLAPASNRGFHALHRMPLVSASPRLFLRTNPFRQPRINVPIFRRHPQLESRRTFSVGPTVDAVVTSAQALFTGTHYALGTPWFLTIPIIALSITLVARLPLAVHARRVLQRRASLAPMLQAWHAKHARDIFLDPALQSLPKEKKLKLASVRFAKTQARIYAAFGVQRWKDFSGLGVFPVWLIGIEALRRLCGGPAGLLGSLIGSNTPADIAASTRDAVSDAALTGDVIPAVGQDTIAAGADFSLTTGGCLWFPDLMAADPWHILPFALSAIMILNIIPRTQTGMRAVLGLDMPGVNGNPRLRLTRVLIIVAGAIGPLTMNLPAALHLYWLATSTFALVVNDVIHKFMPITPSGVTACKVKEPLFVRPRRQIVEPEDQDRT